jgi:hypothetical protein
MKVMVMVKGAGADEDKIEPTEEMFRAMGEYNEQLVKAGIMLDGNGLLPSAKGAQVVFEGGQTSVVEGPFAESKEVIGGYWIWEVSTLEEAIEWARRCPQGPADMRSLLELRPIASAEDFGDAYTDEVREQEERLAAELREQRGAA